MKKPRVIVLLGVGAYFIQDDCSEIRMRNQKKWQGEAQTVLEISWKNTWGFGTFILCDVISVCWVHYGGDSFIAWVQGGGGREMRCWLYPCRKLWVFFPNRKETVSLLNSLQDSCFNFHRKPLSYSQSNYDVTHRGRNFPIWAASTE